MDFQMFKQYNPQRPRRAARILDQQWIPLKVIITLWHHQCLTRAEMLSRLGMEYSFYPSMGQLVARLASWNLKVYTRREHDIDASPDVLTCPQNFNAAIHSVVNSYQSWAESLEEAERTSPDLTPTAIPVSNLMHPHDGSTLSSSKSTACKDNGSDHQISSPRNNKTPVDALFLSTEAQTRLFPAFASQRSSFRLQSDASHAVNDTGIDPTDYPLLIERHREALEAKLRDVCQSLRSDMLPVILFLRFRSDWLRMMDGGIKLQFSHQNCYLGLATSMLLPAYVHNTLIEFREFLFGPKRRDFFNALMTFCTVLSGLNNFKASVQLQEYLMYCCLATPTYNLLPDQLFTGISRVVTSNAMTWKNTSFSARLGSPNCFEGIFEMPQRTQSEEQISHEEGECKNNDFACRLPATLQVMLRVRLFLAYSLQDIIENGTSTLQKSDRFTLQLLITVLRYWHVGRDVISAFRRRAQFCSHGSHVYDNDRSTGILIHLLVSTCSRASIDSDASFEGNVATVRDLIVEELKNLFDTCFWDVASMIPSDTDQYSAGGSPLRRELVSHDDDVYLKRLLALCIVLNSGPGCRGQDIASYIREDLEIRLQEVEVLFVGCTFQALLAHKFEGNQPSLHSLPDLRPLWRLIEGATGLLIKGRYDESSCLFAKLQQRFNKIGPNAQQLVIAGGSVYDMLVAASNPRVYNLQHLRHSQSSGPRSSAFTLVEEIFHAFLDIGEIEDTSEEPTAAISLSHAGKLSSRMERVELGQESVDAGQMEGPSEVSITASGSSSSTATMPDKPELLTDITMIQADPSSSSWSLQSLAERIPTLRGRRPSVSSEYTSIDSNSSWSFRRVTGYPCSSVASLLSSR